MIFTSADNRYQYPLLSFYCIISAIWLDSKLNEVLKKCLYLLGLITITICGIYLSGGWLSGTSSALPAHLLTAGCGNLEISTLIKTSIDRKDKKIHLKMEAASRNTLSDLFNLSSQWSNSLIYTFDTYNTDWGNCLKPIMHLPDKATLQIEYLYNKDKDELSQDGLLEKVIQFYANKNKKEITISNNGQYILTVQYQKDHNDSLATNVKKNIISKQLYEISDSMISWSAEDYIFTLYKRKILLNTP